ncbi:hypothetical protein GYMLUDRAFT_238118 [Collybiopsis luxurians FD-317 M1]|nr:hypothetical protein GYMLUDRAFT_238118 [Collybiopsis luxurians FD-317 M1]
MAEQDDDIDVEALQAQIDLSMSVTNDLVSSWINTPLKSKSSSYNQNLEAELKEYMRRPPRLGVGASIPESSSVSSRETARLKGQLVGKGKKRAREEEEASTRPVSDDEGESRARAIRKKPVLNPFSIPALKKKKLQENSIPLAKVDDDKTTTAKAASPKSQVYPRKEITAVDTDETRQSVPVKQLKASGSKSSQKSPQHTPSSAAKQSQSPRRDQELPSDLVNAVLNLNGPVGGNMSDSDSDDNDNDGVASASPSQPKKKKRKRRKKKKKAQFDGGSAEVPQTR